MSEHYLKLVREELKSTILSQIPQQRLTSIVQTVRKSLAGVHLLDEIGEEMLALLIKRLNEDVDMLSKVRILKIISQERYEESSVDADLAKIILAVLRAEKLIFSSLVLRLGDRVFYMFYKDCTIEKRSFRKNELALLSIKELTIAEIFACGEVLLDPFYKWSSQSLS